MRPYKNSLETYLMILISIKSAHTKISGNLLNNPRLNVPIRKKYGNLFNDPRIHKSTLY